MTGLHLTRTTELTDEVEALAQRSGGRVGLAGMITSLDRRLRRTVAPCLSRHRAWTWDAADRRDREWWPQGISTDDLADTAGAGVARGRLLATSWYAKSGGSRLSFVDLDRRRYGHARLVVPTADGWEPLQVHAGGIAWYGKHVHVAATARGFWTANTDDLVRAPTDHLLPVRLSHRASADAAVAPLRYSFLSIDADLSSPDLVVGEYGSRRQTRRLARVSLDPATGLPLTDTDGYAEPRLVDGLAGVVRAQGVAAAGGSYYLSASHGPWTPGSLWHGPAGALRERRFALPMGPEDLAHSRCDDRLWTVTEHPQRRWIVSVPRSG